MARLIIRNEVLEDYVHRMEGGMTLVGRSQDCGLRLQCDDVSRFHARLELRDDGSFMLEDLGSSNGTFVNQARIQEPTPITDGDVIRFGTVDACFELESPESADADPQAHDEPVPRTRSKERLVTAGVALLLLGGGAWIVSGLLFEGGAAPREQRPAAKGAVAENTGTAEPSSESRTPTTRPAPTPTEPTAVKATRAPRVTTLRLRDGEVLRGRIIGEDAAFIVFLPESATRERRFAREAVASIDGRKVVLDAAAAYAARLARVGTALELLDLAKWCRAQGLEEECRSVAARVLETLPDDAEARALLGDPGPLPSGESPSPAPSSDSESWRNASPARLTLVRRASLALLGRPLLPNELQLYVDAPNVALYAELGQGAAAWTWWGFSELVEMIAPADLRGVARRLPALGAQLAANELDWRELFVTTIAPLKWSGGDRPAAVKRLLAGMLGPQIRGDARLIEAAARMWRGDRVAVLGERGEGPEDLLRILVRQPDFLRQRVIRLGRLLTGRDPEPAEASRMAFKLAFDPRSFRALRAEQIRKAAAHEPPDGRALSVIQSIRCMYVDALDRVPRPDELLDALLFVQEVGDTETAMGLLATAFASQADVSSAARDPTGTVALLWRRLLSRPPSVAEAKAAAQVLRAGEAGARMLLQVLLSRADYRRI